MIAAPRRKAVFTAIVCCALATLFAWLSYSAALSKSATLDEPLHVASAYAATYLYDYRLDAENPPLWKYWAMLTVRRDAVRIDTTAPAWNAATTPGGGQIVATQILYQTPANNGIAVVNASRGAMVVVGVFVLLLAAGWAYRIAGAAAAIATAVLIAFDPTFLAHAAIVKNDVAMTLLMLVMVAALTEAIGRLTVINTLAIALACGAAMSVKFSGVLYPMIAIITLIVRALSSQTWATVGGEIHTRARRLIAAAAVACVVAVVSVVMIWAAYGFRYSVSRDLAVQLNFSALREVLGYQETANTLDHEPTPTELAAWRPALGPRVLDWIDRHRLMPQAWSAGLLGVIAAMARHQNYLLGQVKWGGWWYYFPLATLFKTPFATLAAGAVAAAMLSLRRITLDDRARRALCCIGIATAMYLGSAMTQDINHGIRHLLPIFALLHIAVGVVFAKALETWRKPALAGGVALAILLACESLTTFPNYLSFFNLAARQWRGGFALLGDSNLDWGQDLPQLAAWRERHPSERLYLAYYGAADPAAYGIDYINLSGGFFLGPPAQNVTAPGVIAVSATRLQGLYMSDELRRSFARLAKLPVREILQGGTIYLFDTPPPATSR